MEQTLVNNLTSLVLWPNETYSDYYELDSNTSAVNKSSPASTAAAAASENIYGYPKVQAVLDFLNLYYLGALIIVGLLGNGKNVVAFILNRNELRSPSYYLASLALADVVFLITILFLWLGQFKIYLFTQAGFYQTLFYLSSVSSCVSAWMVAAFTFERLIVVRYPLKRVKICTVRRAKIIIFCLTAGAFIFQLISLFPTGVINKKGKGTHASRLPFYYEMMRILSILETAFTLVIPPVIIVFLNGFIIHDLFQFNRTFNAGGNKHRATASSISRTPHCHQQGDVQMKTYSESKRNQLSHHQTGISETNNVSLNGGVTNDIINTSPISRDNVNISIGRHHSFSSESSNHDNRYVNTLAIVEDRHQCSMPPVLLLNGRHKPLSMMSSSSSCDVNLIKEATISTCDSENNVDVSNQIRGRESAVDDGISNQPLGNMDAIEMDILSPPSQDVEPRTEANSITVEIDQPQQSILTRICKVFKFNRSGESNASTEYSITKKLVLISTVHILLNLPSYTLNLKNFIDETIASRSDVQMTLTTWYLHQFSMVLYYTSFSINFLLYPNSSNSFNLNFKFFIRCCWRRSRPSPEAVFTV